MNPFVIGLTGGVASGKSEASAFLASLGAFVVDADQVAREVALIPEVQNQLKERWPQAFKDGVLDRKALGKIIFSSREEREKLNLILHPPIINRVLRTIEQCGEKVCVMVAPLLIEGGLHNMVDEIWVLNVSKELQVKRLMERDKISKEEALKIVESQMPVEEKLAHAHRIIDNSGPLEKMKAQLEEEWKSTGSFHR